MKKQDENNTRGRIDEICLRKMEFKKRNGAETVSHTVFSTLCFLVPRGAESETN
jgi:hypothetical protein